jgi:hypothetical protein
MPTYWKITAFSNYDASRSPKCVSTILNQSKYNNNSEVVDEEKRVEHQGETIVRLQTDDVTFS